jgi:signal transduction histidine kinase
VDHRIGRYAVARRALVAAVLGSALCGGAAPAAEAPAQIVTLSATDPYLPAFVVIEHAAREAILAGAGRNVAFHVETLDMLRFPRAQLEREALALLGKKYRGLKVDAVVAVETTALDFAERYGSELWPGAAIVYHSVPLRALSGRTLGPRTTGVPVRYEVAPTLELALRLRPGTRRIVAVGGSSEFDRALQGLARAALEGVVGRVAVEYLFDASLAEARAAVGALPPDAIVLYLSMFRDRTGRQFVPRDALSRLAEASSAPIFSIFDTYLGAGTVGGSMTTFEAQGRRAGELVARVLRGESPAELGIQPPVAPGCIADWRQLRRWGIDAGLVPADCDVRFREPGAWERYRWQIVGALALILAQMALIAALLFQRRRRQTAESAVQQHRVELAHAGRLAVAGELTAAIAHEVNQPLGAILANVDAAEMLLDSGAARTGELREILADVRRDDLRASEVIRRLRTLLAGHETARERVDLNDTVAVVFRLLAAESKRRRVELVAELETALPGVCGDRVHLQQVLLNLVMNAMDAMADTRETARRVTVRTALRSDGSIEVAVSDHGHGVTADQIPKLFDSFFTTKRRGMGLGLSIARSIVEAHGGRIWAEPGSREGATFRFTLPAAEDPVPSTAVVRPA